jgi:hypothetical protein
MREEPLALSKKTEVYCPICRNGTCQALGWPYCRGSGVLHCASGASAHTVAHSVPHKRAQVWGQSEHSGILGLKPATPPVLSPLLQLMCVEASPGSGLEGA